VRNTAAHEVMVVTDTYEHVDRRQRQHSFLLLLCFALSLSEKTLKVYRATFLISHHPTSQQDPTHLRDATFLTFRNLFQLLSQLGSYA